MGEYLKEQILTRVASSQSPISGGGFKATLSKEYAKQKQAEVGNKKANLELSGGMLDSLGFKVTPNGIEIGVYGSAAERADGHNNFSNTSTLPERKFLPEEGERFKGDIEKEVKRIIEDKLVEQLEIGRRDFALIKNKKELMLKMRELFPDMSLTRATDAALRNRQFRELFDEFNLTRFFDDED